MILSFINGATMMACLVAALLFLRFWRDTNDRFFGLFSLAFLILSIDRLTIVLAGGITEVEPRNYLIRCFGFLIIIWAVIEKNKGSRHRPDAP